MTDNVEQFHAKFTAPAEAEDVVPWQEPGQNGHKEAWEEPQWDEPRAAPEPWEARTADWLTPAQLRSVVFRRAAFGKRGLDEQQVNSFLDRVEQELTVLLQEKRALEAEVTRLREYVAGTSQPETPPQHGKELETKQEEPVPVQQAVSRVHEAHVYAASILSQAQQTADQYMQEAQQYSRELVEDARGRRAELLARAAEHGEDEGAEQLRATNRHYRGNLRDSLRLVLADLDEWEQAELTGPSEQPKEEPGQP
ncbi:DivIVA domain-containing protein [Nonomuraea sediminis]|uniref:DivIVA domain-containing protein n=1 Tax=Nonomuraea sediminis TaxID=2835864 RepID=UPI001BDDA74B|nr:DivIVA domain-containing protein [Nonomuraea sediminis]